MHINLKQSEENEQTRIWDKDPEQPIKHTSEAPPAASFEEKETSLPPKPKDTPALRLDHFGALKGAA